MCPLAEVSWVTSPWPFPRVGGGAKEQRGLVKVASFWKVGNLHGGMRGSIYFHNRLTTRRFEDIIWADKPDFIPTEEFRGDNAVS